MSPGAGSVDALWYAERVAADDDFLPVPLAMAAETFRRVGELTRARAIVAVSDPAALTAPARVRLLVTDALLRAEAGRTDAHIALERALDTAAPERILRPLDATDPDLHGLLEKHASWGTRHVGLIGGLLARKPATAHLELSARETEVLAYLRTTMTLAEIGTALYLSTNTVKTHVQSPYRKLGVTNRRGAVQVRL